MNTLKKRREALELSLRNVEEGTGTSASTISRMERGHNVEYKHYVAVTSFYDRKEKFKDVVRKVSSEFKSLQDNIIYKVLPENPQEFVERDKVKNEKEEFAIPKGGWYIEVPNEQDCQLFWDYFGVNNHISNTGVWFYSDCKMARVDPDDFIDLGKTKITIDQFKKYILKMKEAPKTKVEPNLSELTERISKLEDTVSKLTKTPTQTVPQRGKEETETKYPCLMRSKNTGSIVLFLGDKHGIRIAPPRGCNIEITGRIESNWIMRMFEPFSFQEPELPTQEEIDQQAEAAHPISHGNRWAFRQGADFVLNYIKRKQQKSK